jgi:hypothetical protein
MKKGSCIVLLILLSYSFAVYADEIERKIDFSYYHKTDEIDTETEKIA